METSKVKLAYSKILPFSGFYCINLFGYLIRREKYRNIPISQKTLNHELIHTLQSEDIIPNSKNNTFLRILGYTIFYIFYLIEWIIKVICSIFTLFHIRAYRSISFEQEAYNNESNLTYQDTRKKYAWLKYIFKVVWKS